MTFSRLRLPDLIEDLDLYPRAAVFSGHVAELEEALRAGVELPPPIIDAASKRIVDGFHRVRALRRVLGPDAEIDVELREYASDAELFLDAMRLNGHHGRRMSSFDIARCARIAETLSIDPEQVATVLSVRPDRLGEIRAVKEAVTVEGARVPIRRGLAHLAGRTLSPRQAEAARRIGGQTPLYHANQLIELLEADALPAEDRGLLERLTLLRDLLAERLAPVEAGAGR
ncbi:MAG: hypothetical protein HMLKMBBP_01090 [Planctomycetes bacterium]|nr:hypothetical protein [Planctomycetota bacterium]